jgi:molybdate transport system ATP-binding protein
LATEPALLLLDEPLAALDAGTRRAMRRALKQHLAEFPGVCLLVTHDPLDAYTIADRVIVVERGSVAQAGTLAEITARPRSNYVAELVGVNLLEGDATGGTVVTRTGGRVVAAHASDGPTLVVISPHAIAIYRTPPDGSPRNVWSVVVADIDRTADRVRVRLDGEVPLVAEITTTALHALELQPGARVWATVKATEITTYPA